jgi:hypothetical protein
LKAVSRITIYCDPAYSLQTFDILSYVASILNWLNILKNLSLVQESSIYYKNR